MTFKLPRSHTHERRLVSGLTQDLIDKLIIKRPRIYCLNTLLKALSTKNLMNYSSLIGNLAKVSETD